MTAAPDQSLRARARQKPDREISAGSFAPGRGATRHAAVISVGMEPAPTSSRRGSHVGGVGRVVAGGGMLVGLLAWASLGQAAAPVFGPSAAVNGGALTDSGNDGSPRIVTDGHGTWVTVWASTDDLGGTIGTDSDVLSARSSDLGISWSAPVPVNVTAPSDGEFDLRPRSRPMAAGSGSPSGSPPMASTPTSWSPARPIPARAGVLPFRSTPMPAATSGTMITRRS